MQTVFVSISQQTVFVSGLDPNTENVPVKVLDCDTISQVKEKALDTIYRATPYSGRPRKEDLDLGESLCELWSEPLWSLEKFFWGVVFDKLFSISRITWNEEIKDANRKNKLSNGHFKYMVSHMKWWQCFSKKTYLNDVFLILGYKLWKSSFEKFS